MRPWKSLRSLRAYKQRALPALLLITFRPEFEAPWKGSPDVAAIALQRNSSEVASAQCASSNSIKSGLCLAKPSI